MKRKASTSHDEAEATICELRKGWEFAESRVPNWCSDSTDVPSIPAPLLKRRLACSEIRTTPESRFADGSQGLLFRAEQRPSTGSRGAKMNLRYLPIS
jgi:hypothetical protein